MHELKTDLPITPSPHLHLTPDSFFLPTANCQLSFATDARIKDKSPHHPISPSPPHSSLLLCQLLTANFPLPRMHELKTNLPITPSPHLHLTPLAPCPKPTPNPSLKLRIPKKDTAYEACPPPPALLIPFVIHLLNM